MRITTTHLADQVTAASQRAEARLATASGVASSGLRVQVASDDPVAWAAAQRDKVRQALGAGTGAAIQTSTTSLEQTDGALSTIGDAISRARELAVQGASDTNANERAALGTQVQALYAAALAAANTQGSDGAYLLAGAQTAAPPFDAAGVYQGDAATRAVATSEHGSDAVSVAGTALTATAGVDILPELAKLATALSANNLVGIQAGLGALTTATRQVGTARQQAGVGLAALSDAETSRQALATHLSTSISGLVEADTVGAISELSQASQALDITRAVGSNVLASLAKLAQG
jgi:flagellar hook-associated protein 3 FlgL